MDCLALLRCQDRGFTCRLFAGLRVRVTPVQRGRWKERRLPGVIRMLNGDLFSLAFHWERVARVKGRFWASGYLQRLA